MRVVHAIKSKTFCCSGQDSTESFEDVGHSEDARELMEEYFIGVVAGVSRINANKLFVTWGNQFFYL